VGQKPTQPSDYFGRDRSTGYLIRQPHIQHEFTGKPVAGHRLPGDFGHHLPSPVHETSIRVLRIFLVRELQVMRPFPNSAMS